MSETYDYVVVGGGSAGCIAAAELADRGHAVLLLEHGDRAEDNPETLRADGYKDAFVNDRLMWERFTVKQPGLGGRRIYVGSGRGMGGSGSVNAMVYTRGAVEDFDAMGDGWRWRDVVAPFETMERKLGIQRRAPTAWTEACIAAAEEEGFRRKDDLNDGDLSGVLGYEWMSYRGEQRRSAYVAFIKEHARDALVVRTGAAARRVVFDGDKRARGVVYRDAGGEQLATARREVILCAGALETPRLLMLSGIGPAHELRKHGIEVLLDQPGVGANLHDHPNVQLFYAGDRTVDCQYPQLYGFHGPCCYVFYPARSSFREGMLKLLPGIALPQRLYRVAPLVALMRKGIGAAFANRALQRFVARMYGIVVILGKPKSRGTLRLASADPDDAALVDPAYLSDPADLTAMLDGVALARRIAHARPLAGWGNRELIPGHHANPARFIRRNAMTTYHYAGTCRFGGDDAPLSPRLTLRGVTGVRVADASAIPFTPISAMNAPSMLVGYRVAQFIDDASRR